MSVPWVARTECAAVHVVSAVPGLGIPQARSLVVFSLAGCPIICYFREHILVRKSYVFKSSWLACRGQYSRLQTKLFFFFNWQLPSDIHFLQAVLWSVFEEKGEKFMVLVSKNHWEGRRPSFYIIDIWQSVNSVFSSGALVCYFVYSLNSQSRGELQSWDDFSELAGEARGQAFETAVAVSRWMQASPWEVP